MRNAGHHPTASDTEEIERQRLRIGSQIRDFHTTACRFLGPDGVVGVLGTPDELSTDGYVSDDVCKPKDCGLPQSTTAIENTLLVFPSSLPGNQTAATLELRGHECRLRRAKANDTLAHIRETLSGLSYQYINKVRQSITTRDHLKAYDSVKLLSREVSFYQQLYNRNSRILRKHIPEMCTRYPHLRRSDCTVSTAVADVNARGQSQVHLPWFWAAQDGWDGDPNAQNVNFDTDRLMECMYAVRKFIFYVCLADL